MIMIKGKELDMVTTILKRQLSEQQRTIRYVIIVEPHTHTSKSNNACIEAGLDFPP